MRCGVSSFGAFRLQSQGSPREAGSWVLLWKLLWTGCAGWEDSGGGRVHGVCTHPIDCHPHRAPVRHWAGTWRAPTTRASCPTTTTAITTLTRESSRTSPARQDWDWGAAPCHPPPQRSHGEGLRHWVWWAQAPASPTPLPGPATPFAPSDATGAASAPASEQLPGPFACPLCLLLARGLSPV